MSRLKTITRRSFLVGSAAIAGGVAFGTYFVAKPHANPLADTLGRDEATFNPWVKISNEAVTLIAPHSDKGQGVASMQAMLIAEELDIEFGQFELEFGTPSPAYYNQALTDEAVRSVVGAMIKVMGVQVTGGSSSAPDSYKKLRLAGAVARETLKAAAAQKSGFATRQLETANGAVQLPDGTQIKYTELAGIAATIEPAYTVKLRDPSAWRMIGKTQQRLDIIPKSTGTQLYGIDLSMDGMAHASVRVNPRKGGGMVGYDASIAETMTGVEKIVPVTGGQPRLPAIHGMPFRLQMRLSLTGVQPHTQRNRLSIGSALALRSHLNISIRNGAMTPPSMTHWRMQR